MSTKALRLYVGHGFTPRLFVRELLASDTIGGATITPSFGYWVDDDGNLFDEDADIITLTVDSVEDEKRLVKLAQRHATLTGEQSVMVEWSTGAITFEDAA